MGGGKKILFELDALDNDLLTTERPEACDEDMRWVDSLTLFVLHVMEVDSDFSGVIEIEHGWFRPVVVLVEEAERYHRCVVGAQFDSQRFIP